MNLFICVLHLMFVKVLCYRGEFSNGYHYEKAFPKDVMVDVINNFGVNLLEAHNEGNNNNIALSPYGATSVLVALGEGVRGYAVQEIQSTVHIPQDVSVVRIGLRDIHRHLKSYFIPKEGFLAGLTLSNEKVPLNDEYKGILRFYGFDLDSFNSPLYPDIFETTTATGMFFKGNASNEETLTTIGLPETFPTEVTPSLAQSTFDEVEATSTTLSIHTTLIDREETLPFDITTTEKMTTKIQTRSTDSITTYSIPTTVQEMNTFAHEQSTTPLSSTSHTEIISQTTPRITTLPIEEKTSLRTTTNVDFITVATNNQESTIIMEKENATTPYSLRNQSTTSEIEITTPMATTQAVVVPKITTTTHLSEATTPALLMTTNNPTDTSYGMFEVQNYETTSNIKNVSTIQGMEDLNNVSSESMLASEEESTIVTKSVTQSVTKVTTEYHTSSSFTTGLIQKEIDRTAYTAPSSIETTVIDSNLITEANYFPTTVNSDDAPDFTGLSTETTNEIKDEALSEGTSKAGDFVTVPITNRPITNRKPTVNANIFTAAPEITTSQTETSTNELISTTIETAVTELKTTSTELDTTSMETDVTSNESEIVSTEASLTELTSTESKSNMELEPISAATESRTSRAPLEETSTEYEIILPETTTIDSEITNPLLDNSTTAFMNKRPTRSIVDYIIARYYDNQIIRNSKGHHYVPDDSLSFLIYGSIREHNINFMSYDAVLPIAYIPVLNAMALSFPLDSKEYYLLLILPVDDTGIDKLINDMSQTISLREIITSLGYAHVRATIPSFMLKGYVVLTPTLQKLGIQRVFEPRQTDFSLMTREKDVYVTNVEQAVTVTIRNYVDPDNLPNYRNLQRARPVEFKADHPFLYFVMDTQIHVALMAGKIVNPLNSRIR